MDQLLIQKLNQLIEESECGASYTNGQGSYADGVYSVTTELRQMLKKHEEDYEQRTNDA